MTVHKNMPAYRTIRAMLVDDLQRFINVHLLCSLLWDTGFLMQASCSPYVSLSSSVKMNLQDAIFTWLFSNPLPHFKCNNTEKLTIKLFDSSDEAPIPMVRKTQTECVPEEIIQASS